MYLADRYELIIMDTDSFALSFYRFQNVLGRSKYSFAIIATPKNFVLALKLNLIMPCPFTALRIVCAGPTNLIDALYSVLSI